jgi:hypothetical protein
VMDYSMIHHPCVLTDIDSYCPQVPPTFGSLDPHQEHSCQWRLTFGIQGEFRDRDRQTESGEDGELITTGTIDVHFVPRPSGNIFIFAI